MARLRPDLSTTRIGEDLLVHNPATGLVHALNPAAAAVFTLCPLVADRGELIDTLTEATGLDADTLTRDVESAFETFRRLGLITAGSTDNSATSSSNTTTDSATSGSNADSTVDTATSATTVTPPRTAVAGHPGEAGHLSTAVAGHPGEAGHLVGTESGHGEGRAAAPGPGPRFAVLDQVVEIRCPFAAAEDRVRAELCDLITDSHPTVILDLAAPEEPDGPLTTTSPPWSGRRWADLDEFVDQLPTALNILAPRSQRLLVLHAGAVIHPDGGVVVLAGRSGAGKSTLTAALVQAGWGYLTDEAIGIRVGTLEVVGFPKPLALDATGRKLLGLPNGGSHTALGELTPTGQVADTQESEAQESDTRESNARESIFTATATTSTWSGFRGNEPARWLGSLRLRAVVLPQRQRGAELHAEALSDPVRAALDLAPHCLNLTAGADTAMAALSDAAASVPVIHLVHRGVEHDCPALIRLLGSRT